jgi:hypothetical protein
MGYRQALSPHRLFVTSSWDKSVCLSAFDYDPQMGVAATKPVQRYNKLVGSATSVFAYGVYTVCTVGHEWIAAGTFNKCMLYDIESALPVGCYEAEGRTIDGIACVYVMPVGCSLNFSNLISHADMWSVNALCYIDTRHVLAVGSNDAKIRLYDSRYPALRGASSRPKPTCVF